MKRKIDEKKTDMLGIFVTNDQLGCKTPHLPMKKLFFASIIACMLASSAFAQTGASGTTFSATPSIQMANPGGTFSVTLSLSGMTPPANITAFDLYLVTASSNSGFFTITGSTPTGPFNAFGPTIPGSGDPLSTAAAANFVRNNVDLGYSGTAQNPPYNLSLESVSFSIGANVPAGTYTFFTSTQANAGNFYSDVADTSSGVFTVGQGSFQITVVPEPTTLTMVGLGAIGMCGLNYLRRKRNS